MDKQMYTYTKRYGLYLFLYLHLHPYVCMYVCMCVSIYVCIYVCLYIYTHMYIHDKYCVYLRIHVYIHIEARVGVVCTPGRFTSTSAPESEKGLGIRVWLQG